jgi:glycosyltransferase involved in cell wall biosynthesis
VYFDWIQSFILGKTLLVTLLKCVSFFLEITYLTRVKGLPVIHTLHNMQNHAGRWVRIERAMQGWFMRRCSRIRVYSETTLRKVVRLYKTDPGKVFVIQDIPFYFHYPQGATQAQSRALLKLPPGAFVYLFLGMVKPYKGVEHLIEAFKQTAGPDDYLVIAGKSDLAAYSDSIAVLTGGHPRILFPNQFIPDEQVQYYCEAADVMVLPFRNVEHSGSVDLAISFAKPVVTLKTPFMQELLAHQTGLLFNSIQELPSLLRKAKAADLKAIGAANRRVAESSNYREFIQLFRY